MGNWNDISPWGLVAIFVVLVALGGLIPRWTLVRILNEKDKIIEGKDILIAKLESGLDKRDEQFERMFDRTDVIVKLLEDLKQAGQAQRTGSP